MPITNRIFLHDSKRSYAELADNNGVHTGHLVISPLDVGKHGSPVELRNALYQAALDAAERLTPEAEPAEADAQVTPPDRPAYVRPPGIAIGDPGAQLDALIESESEGAPRSVGDGFASSGERPKLEGNGVHL